MNYMKQVDAWLDELGITDDEVKRAIKDKILESYRNGQEYGKKGRSSAVRKVAGTFGKEAVRQATYSSSKRGQYNKPRTKRQYAYGKRN